jgi:hypothetical protein
LDSPTIKGLHLGEAILALACLLDVWVSIALPPGHLLWDPVPPFKKLDESVIEEEYVRLEG